MTTKTRHRQAPADYDPSRFPAFAVTVDVVILTMSRRRAARAARVPRRGAVRGHVGDPRRLQASRRDAGRGGDAGAGRGDRRRGREPADPVRRLRRSRARPADERRDDRVSRGAPRRGDARRPDRTRRPPRCCRCPTCSTGRSSWRSTTGRSCATRSSASASSSRSRASQRRSSERRSRWPSCARCTRPSGACSSTPRTSGAASSRRTAG